MEIPNQPMNLVQSVLHLMICHGKSQETIARELGVMRKTVHRALEGSVDPSDKLLRALGIRRQVSYVLAHVPEPIPRPPKRAPRMPAKHVPRRTPPPPVPVAPSVPAAVTMSKADVLVAVRYRLNPGQTWAAFQADNQGMEWQAYCEAQTPVIAEARAPVPRPSESDPYAHLRRPMTPDYRTAKPIGTLPNLAQVVQPEAGGE